MNLKNILQIPQNKKLVVTITGEPGAGKTSLACTFPKPVMIRTEDGLRSVANKPHAFPLVESFDDVINQLTMLITEEHDFETLIIDSVTQLNTLFEKYVIDSDPRKKDTTTLASCLGGFGAGYLAVANLHHRIRNACGILNDKKNMSIVFIAHNKIVTIEPPASDKYHVYTIDMHDKSQAHYINNVDLVGHLGQEIMTRKNTAGDKNQAFTTGRVLLNCQKVPTHVTKNRLNIVEPIEFKLNENPLKEYI